MALSIKDKFASIDKKRISAAAAEILNDLKKETKNFTKVSASLRSDFETVYQKIRDKKPEAIKGTDEYTAFTKKQSKGKAKTNKYKKEVDDKYKGKGVDMDRDKPRAAKPFGARVKGKHIYRKPTPADFAAGNVYYEYRPNRADVKIKRFPKLEQGGALEEYKKHASEYHRLG